jgi:hypothetical protein
LTSEFTNAASASQGFFDCLGLQVRQLAVANLFSGLAWRRNMSLMANHVLKILLLCSGIKVPWVAAASIAASVIDLQSAWVAKKQLVGGSVGGASFAGMGPVAVSVTANARFPMPAKGRFANGNLSKKILPGPRGRYIGSHQPGVAGWSRSGVCGSPTTQSYAAALGGRSG